MSDQTWLTVVVSAVTSGVVSVTVQRISRRLDRRQERKDTADAERKAEAAKKPHFIVRHVNNQAYRLVNDGDILATSIKVSTPDNPRGQIVRLPDTFDLAPETGQEFLVRRAMQLPSVDHLMVHCEQLAGPVAVAMPN